MKASLIFFIGKGVSIKLSLNFESVDDNLPSLILLSEYGGIWDVYFETVYSVFETDFVHSKPKFGTYRVNLKHHPSYDGKSATFWHMISEGNIESERVPDIRRCERISWVKYFMEKFNGDKPDGNSKLLWWIEIRHGRGGREERIHLTNSNYDYIVVIANRKQYVLPWTAFYVEYDHQRRKYKKKFQEYWKNNSL